MNIYLVSHVIHKGAPTKLRERKELERVKKIPVWEKRDSDF